MPAFTENFDSISDWTFDPVGHDNVTLTALEAYDGLLSAEALSDPSEDWAVHRPDMVDGGNPATTYWVSFAIMLPSWAPLWHNGTPGSRFTPIPGMNFDETDPIGSNWTMILEATSATTGVLGSFSDFAFTAGVWHTIRLGVRRDGANGTHELWLDNVQLENLGPFNIGSGGLMGPVIYSDVSAIDPTTYYVDALTWSPVADPGEPVAGGGGGGSIIVPGGLSGRRFFQSLPWRVIVADGALDAAGEPDPASGGTITLLDRLASDRRMLVALGKPRQFDCHVPSDSPEINIAYTDVYEESFLAEGNRLLFVFRREGDYTTDPSDKPWVIRGSFIIMRIADDAQSEDGRSRLTAYDPRMLLYKRKAMNPVTGLDIGPKGYTYVGDEVGEIAYDVLTQAMFTQGSARIINSVTNVGTTEVIEKFTIQQGMSVGEVWDQLEATGKLDIILEPIYDPLTAPGYLCEAFYFAQAGVQNPAAVFAWDKPSRSLVGVNHEQDGTQRANRVRLGISQGGKMAYPNPPTDQDSVDKYGEYWVQQWFPVQNKASAVRALADGELAARRAARRTVSITPAAERSPIPLLDYGLGDEVQVAWSNKLRQPLLRAPNFSRIVEIPISIDDNALESVQQAIVEPTTTIFPVTRLPLGGPSFVGGDGGDEEEGDLQPPQPGTVA